mmetsp:Transcript_13854/g.18500  ORF Transcript_13854/g.18500 Transcript_13854/m.18500 type:complete len:106 (+) Transcript_13854:76-393(+)
MSNLVPMYVRVKRKKQTIFVTVEKSDNFLSLKQKLTDIISVPASSIKLFASKDESVGDLQDTAFLDSFIENDAVLYMILKQENSEAWEEIEVDDFKQPTSVKPTS